MISLADWTLADRRAHAVEMAAVLAVEDQIQQLKRQQDMHLRKAGAIALKYCREDQD